MDTHTLPQCFNNADVVQLVQSLNRKEDDYIFAQDVVITYPNLAHDYTTICPDRRDLGNATKKASKGDYSGDVMLQGLREDVKLMVDNCIRYNGPDSKLAVTARNFAVFAERAIDKFVLQHSAELPAALLPPNPLRQELEEVVLSLNRKEDDGVFAVDVTETYPDIKANYLAACPHVMHLALMQQKARDGEYFLVDGKEHLVWGRSVAESLSLLRADIELIVKNCITFNQSLELWVKRAHSFQKYAHRVVDEFVIRKAPILNGTLTGVHHFVSSAKERTEGKSTTSHGDGVVVGQKRSRDSVLLPLTPAVLNVEMGPSLPSNINEIVELQTNNLPAPVWSAVQPSFGIPSLIRQRLVSDHLSRDTLRPRLIGYRVKWSEVYHLSLHPNAECGDPEIMLDQSHSGAALLTAFEAHVRDIFSSERQKNEDVQNPFHCSWEEEQLYMDVLCTIRSQFNRLFLSALVYEKEATDLRAFAATQGVPLWLCMGSEEVIEDKDAKDTDLWLPRVHFLYLLRFVVQFPQITALCCCMPEKVLGDEGPIRHSSRLYLPSASKLLIEQVCTISQELLLFSERYEKLLLEE